MKFIASSARKGKHLMCFRLAKTVEQETLSADPAGNSKRATPLGVALVELLMFSCYSASW